MKNVLNISLAILLLCAINYTFAQKGVGINSSGAAADNSAMLDVSSSNQGMLVPRLSTAQRNSIPAPATGLFIFNTDCNSFNYYTGYSWLPVNLAPTLTTPAVISGQDTVCQNSAGVAYSVSPVSGATSFTWYVPGGSAVASGQGTNSVTVNFSTSSGNICVIASNNCETSLSSCKAITLESPVSSAPVATAGTNDTYTGFTANWNAVTGATNYRLDIAEDIGFGSMVAGYNSLNVGLVQTFDVTGLTCGTTYYYRVRGENTCGQSANSNTITKATSDCPVVTVYQDECGTTYSYNEVSTSTGEVWLDRNLGASRVAGSMSDYEAYGSLFQWGRLADGHECINWTSSTSGTAVNGTTTTRSTTDDPGHNLFIRYSSSPYDWRNPQNDNLWQGVSGINNPCPTGYRVPTSAELNAERLTWSSNDPTGAFNSPLKFVRPGYRDMYDGDIYDSNSIGYHWSSTPYSGFITSHNLDIRNGNAFIGDNCRSQGLSVRCIKD